MCKQALIGQRWFSQRGLKATVVQTDNDCAKLQAQTTANDCKQWLANQRYTDYSCQTLCF